MSLKSLAEYLQYGSAYIEDDLRDEYRALQIIHRKLHEDMEDGKKQDDKKTEVKP